MAGKRLGPRAMAAGKTPPALPPMWSAPIRPDGKVEFIPGLMNRTVAVVDDGYPVPDSPRWMTRSHMLEKFDVWTYDMDAREWELENDVE